MANTTLYLFPTFPQQYDEAVARATIPSIPAVALLCLQLALMIIVTAFTASTSIFRGAGLPAMLTCTYLQLPYVVSIQHTVYRAFLGAAGVYVNILYIDVVLLHRWAFEPRGPTSSLGGLAPSQTIKAVNFAAPKTSSEGILERLRFGVSVTLNARFPNTKWAVKNIPALPRNKRNHLLSKSEFLHSTLRRLSCYILVLDVVGSIPDDGNKPVIFSSDKIAFFSRMGEVTGQEIIARITSQLAYWAIQYVIIQAVYATCALLAVWMDFTGVESWPPVFGSVRDSYSIRKFWGSFYHQLIRRGCGSIAHAITYSTLQLPKGEMPGRYLFIFLTFAVSGIFHTGSDITQGLQLSESGAMKFFCLQACGIVLEDVVQALLSRTGICFSETAKRKIGYAWIMCWLIWTTPTWTFPMMQRDNGGKILPFSILKFMIGNDGCAAVGLKA